MWKRKIILPLFLFVSCFSSVGYCSTYTITEEQLTALETHLTELEQNNQKLSAMLEASDKDLTISLTALKTCQQELTKLKTELLQSKIETERAEKSLLTANAELKNAALLCKQSEKQKSRIKAQRTVWQIIAAGLLVWGCSR